MEKQFESFESQFLSKDEMLIVRVECSLEDLKGREKERGDRAIGLAEKQNESIHNFLTYDLRVNSSLLSPKEISEFIMDSILK